MHMADALVTPVVAGTMYACSGAAMAYSIRKVRLENDARKIPVIGVMGAGVFAAQMINFSIPGTGSSGHLCGGMLLSAVLGPEAGFLAMIGVLLVQCLMFADGGLLALGCNIWNMAFYGCFIGAMVIWRQIMKRGISKRKIAAASVLGCMVTLQLGAFSVTLETLASGVTELPFAAFAAVMQPIHLAIGLVEGLITAAVLCFIYEARPELLWGHTGWAGCGQKQGEEGKKGRFTYKGTVAALLAAAAVTGGLLSLAASSDPDGLEWSMERVAETSELEAEGRAYEMAGRVQETTAVLPDYAWKNSESAAGTAFSGIVGGAAVILLCVGCSFLFRFFRNRAAKNE